METILVVRIESLAGLLICSLGELYSCGTVTDFRRSFPVSFSGCSPLKPRWKVGQVTSLEIDGCPLISTAGQRIADQLLTKRAASTWSH